MLRWRAWLPPALVSCPLCCHQAEITRLKRELSESKDMALVRLLPLLLHFFFLVQTRN